MTKLGLFKEYKDRLALENLLIYSIDAEKKAFDNIQHPLIKIFFANREFQKELF